MGKQSQPPAKGRDWWIVRGTLGVIYALVGLIGFVFLSFLSYPSADRQIERALEMSIAATKQGQPGGVAEMFFTSYAAAKGTEASLDPLTVRQLRPEVVIGHRGIKFEGDRAVIPSPLHMKIEPTPGQTVEVAAKVNIWFVSERKTTFLGLPAKKWRIQSVEYAGDIPKPPHN